MTVSGEGEDFGLAENLADPPAAVAGGADVGQVEGLIWSDATGVDVVSVEVGGDHVAVPVEGDTWRNAQIVYFDMTANEIYSAPRVQDLEASGGTAAVEAVSQYFSMPLDGPPPGPTTGPLPPWWDKPKTEGTNQDDGPSPVVG
jgi:hypothetical protein